MEIILQPWPWFVGGPLIALTLFLYFYFGKNFGASTNFETLCTIAGAGRVSNYFKKDWKERDFALLFVVGLIVGGFISSNYLIPRSRILKQFRNQETVAQWNLTLKSQPLEIENIGSLSLNEKKDRRASCRERV